MDDLLGRLGRWLRIIALLCVMSAAALAQAPRTPELPPAVVTDGETAPLPRLLDAPVLPGCTPGQGSGKPPLGAVPRPNEETLKDYNQFFERTIDPANTLDLVLGQPRLMVFKEAPRRIQLPDDKTASYTIISERELSIVPIKVGTTVLNLWFDDPKAKVKQRVLSYLVRVLPDPEQKERLVAQLKELQKEINTAFCDSVICLSLVGDKIVVSGQAKDIAEAAEIIQVVGRSTGNQGGAGNRTGQRGTAGIPVGTGDAGTPLTPAAPGTPTPGTPGTPGAPPGEAAAPGTPGLSNYLTGSFANIVNLLRVPGEQQVMLKVAVAEVDRTAARSIGVNFRVLNNQRMPVFSQLTNGLLGTTSGGGGGSGVGGGGTGSTAGTGGGVNLPFTLDNGLIPVALNALRRLDLARTLAEPNLVTLNGQPANFQAGGSFPVPVVTGATALGLQGVNFVQFGVQLQFTPYITDKDRIRINITASVSTVDPSLGTNIGSGGGGGTNVPGLQSRQFQTTVEMREGQTLSVAGLIRNDLAVSSSRVPLLGDIPILSRAWSTNNTSHLDQELVITVTPILVHPLDPKQCPPLPGNDVFEPSDLEFYLWGRMESRRHYDFRTPARTNFAQLIRYQHCENVFITGPQGHSDGKAPIAPPTPAPPLPPAIVAPPVAGEAKLETTPDK